MIQNDHFARFWTCFIMLPEVLSLMHAFTNESLKLYLLSISIPEIHLKGQT